MLLDKGTKRKLPQAQLKKRIGHIQTEKFPDGVLVAQTVEDMRHESRLDSNMSQEIVSLVRFLQYAWDVVLKNTIGIFRQDDILSLSALDGSCSHSNPVSRESQ